MCLHPTEHARKNAEVHPVQNDWLRHSTNRPIHMDTWIHSTGNYQPTPHRGTMTRQCALGWQSMWIATTVGEPARRGRPIATLQTATTPWQELVTWHPSLQNHPQSDSEQKDTPDREWLEELEEGTTFGAPAHSHYGGFPQSPVPANQVSPVSVAGHGRNTWHLGSVSRFHVGRGSILKRPYARCDSKSR